MRYVMIVLVSLPFMYGCEMYKSVKTSYIEIGGEIRETSRESRSSYDTGIPRELTDLYGEFTGFGCDDTEKELKQCQSDLFTAKSTQPVCKDEPSNPPPPGEPTSKKMRISHTNGTAWHDEGVAVTQCKSDPMYHCTFNNKIMQQLPNNDKDRHQHTIRNTSDREGQITCTYEGVSETWSVVRGITGGECYKQ